MIKDVIMREIERQGEGFDNKVERPFRGALRLARRSGGCGVGQLNDRGGDPAPGVGPVVIAGESEVLDGRNYGQSGQRHRRSSGSGGRDCRRKGERQ